MLALRASLALLLVARVVTAARRSCHVARHACAHAAAGARCGGRGCGGGGRGAVGARPALRASTRCALSRFGRSARVVTVGGLTRAVPWAQALRHELDRLRGHAAVLERRLALLEHDASGPGERAREKGAAHAAPLESFLEHVRVYLQGCTRGERLSITARGLEAELNEVKAALENAVPLATSARTEAAAAAESAAAGERRTSTMMRSRELEARAAREAAARLAALAREIGGAAADSTDVDLSAAEAELSTASAMWAPYAAAAGAIAAETGRLDDACGRLRDACDAALDAGDDAGRALAALAARRTAVALHLDAAQDKAILAFASHYLSGHHGQQALPPAQEDSAVAGAAPPTPAVPHHAPPWAPAPPGRRKGDKPVRSFAH